MTVALATANSAFVLALTPGTPDCVGFGAVLPWLPDVVVEAAVQQGCY
jgi:hypothetical protein